MDPNALLDRLLVTAREITGNRIASIPPIGKEDDSDVYVDPREFDDLKANAQELAEGILALDEWLRKGGFRPFAWDVRRRKTT